jgi:hypothetical protein
VINDKEQSIISIIQSDQAGALKLFNSLEASRQAALIHEAAPEDKKELLFLAKDLSSLLNALPGRDVYLALESSTASEFDVLIERIGPEHLNFMLAMGCWRDGSIDDGRIIHWLEIINNCDDTLAARAISEIEADFLAAALRPHLDMVCIDDDDVADCHGMSEAYAFTPENCRFDNDTVENFMVRLYSIDKTLFALLCYKRAFANQDDIFEGAMLAYSRRLEKEGLPSYKDAATIYEKGWTILQKANIAKPHRKTAVQKRDGTEPFLTLALKHLNESGRGDPHLADEFSRLLMKISVADGGEMDGMARQRTVRKAEVYASLGLEKLGRGDIENAAELLLKNGITVFFKIGFEMISNLRDRVNRIIKTDNDNLNDKCRPEPSLLDQAVLSNAAHEIPRITLESGRSRMIRNLDELNRVEEKVEKIHKNLL